MKIRSPHFKKQYDLSKAELIGQGNFAQVYRIFDSDLNESLAIRKVKKTESDMQDISKQKVINQELRKVQNQNILKIYDIIDTEDDVWYITEYCSGGSLWDVLNLCKDNKMNEKQCLECVLQISKGVQELHNHRITHRDLKPENILLKTKYVTNKILPLIKLADFGLSTQKIIMETIAGTKEYIAPEQAKFHNYTNAVDVWSLGIICDQILHGTPFYSGQNNKQVFNKILKLPYKVRDQSIRLSIKNLLTSLLKKKPYERPIIAVIRKTIQKILQQIQGQTSIAKNQKSKKRDSRDQSFQSSHSSNINKYSNLLGMDSRKVQPKKMVQSRQQQVKQPMRQAIQLVKQKQVSRESKQVNDINIYSKQYAPTITKPMTPNNNVVKTPREQTRRQISGKKIETTISRSKQNSVLKKQNKPDSPQSSKQVLSQKSCRQTKRENKPQIEDQKSEYKNQLNEQKSQSNLSTNNNPMMKSLQTTQIPIYKAQKRKILGHPHQPIIKKQSIRTSHMQVNTYIQKLLQSKKQLQQVTSVLKMQKSPSFLPNTSFTSVEFTINSKRTGQDLDRFKKQYDILNYVKYDDEQYDMNLYRKSVELQKNKSKCKQAFKGMSQQLKQQFLQQVNKYVETYVEKYLK